MGSFHPRAEDLPSQFAVFPLAGALLLPGGKLPLNIFEPRYLAMVEDALSSGRLFGMIQPDPSSPSSPAGPALYDVGCLGRLSSFSETEDGRFLITLDGLIRFSVIEELGVHHGYRRVAADFAPYLADLDVNRPAPALERDKLMHELRGYFARSGFDANWDAIERMSDDSLILTLAMVCPFEPAEKQALLEAPTDEDRAATLLVLLQMGGMDDAGGSANRTAS